MSVDKTEPDSPSPRRRLIGQIALVAVWVYVAMIFLLAIDQQFHWGIFPP
jgi:preprotein translocase subunit SecE